LLRGNEWRYVKECLETNWVSSAGPFVDRFERMVAEYVGTRHAVAVVNGTSALHLALLVSDVRPGDEVLVSTLTFAASANAIRYAGAWPVFIDAEPQHWQMDANLVEEYLRSRAVRRDGVLVDRGTGRRIRAIMPVHILGHPVDMDPIVELADRYGLALIEDAAESLGAKYKGQMVGRLGSVGCFSFNGNKTITTGGGGMIATDDEDLANKARYLSTQAKDDPVEHVHGQIGYNYRLPNVLAAIGCGQLEMLDEAIAAKRRIARRYDEALADVPGVELLRPSADVFCTYWLSTVRIRSDEYGCDSRSLRWALQQRGVQTRPLWQPLHLSPAHRGALAVSRGVAEKLYAQCLSLPSSVGLTEAEQDRVIAGIAEIERIGNADAA
jgi:perosamine synthetase